MKMKLAVPKKLVDLAKIFEQHGKKLYLVGGYVRNAILGIFNTDMDVCSAATNEEIAGWLSGSNYQFFLESAKLGTAKIKFGFMNCEHTTFRTETYEKGGFHSPETVRFVADIKSDAARRDFTVNALYYNILNEEVLDFFGGFNDLKQKTIRCINTPDSVFQSDGLRILRMVRLSSELNFSIHPHTFAVAKKMVGQLDDISTERITAELELILNAYEKYEIKGNQKAYWNGIVALCELNALPHIFAIGNTKKSPSDFVLTQKVGQMLLWYAFLYDLSNLTNQPVEKLVEALSMKRSRKTDLIWTVNLTQNAQNFESHVLDLAKNAEYLPNVIKLLYHCNRTLHRKLYAKWNALKTSGLPLTVGELAIDGNDLKNLGFQNKKIGAVLQQLLKAVLENNCKNDRNALLKQAENLGE